MSAGVWVFLAATLALAEGYFSVPSVQIQANTPQGVKASIIAQAGMKAFEFHAKVRPVGRADEITVDGIVSKVVDGRFTVIDQNTKLNEGDAVNYWVFVEHENLGYRKDDQQYIINKLVPPDAPFSNSTSVIEGQIKPAKCDPTITTYNGRKACKDQLLFNENFSDRIINTDIWRVEKRFPSDAMENEFVSYQESAISIKGNNLNIEPMLLHKQPGFDEDAIETGVLDLTVGCTARGDKYCKLDLSSQPNKILPPVVSGKVSTRNFFRFRYGKVEIRAKLPKGDWIYPIFYLEPLDHYYGENYDSGVIKIASSRGNSKFWHQNENLGNTVLYGGALLSQFEPCRSLHISKYTRGREPWADDYHVFGLVWTDKEIKFTVDDHVYGTVTAPPEGFKKYDTQCKEVPFNVWKSGGSLAPFDQEFYLSLGVAVGGVSDFPDTPDKPWRNRNPDSKASFWSNWTTWSSTWDSNSLLQVDSIKVWAI